MDKPTPAEIAAAIRKRQQTERDFQYATDEQNDARKAARAALNDEVPDFQDMWLEGYDSRAEEVAALTQERDALKQALADVTSEYNKMSERVTAAEVSAFNVNNERDTLRADLATARQELAAMEKALASHLEVDRLVQSVDTLCDENAQRGQLQGLDEKEVEKFTRREWHENTLQSFAAKLCAKFGTPAQPSATFTPDVTWNPTQGTAGAPFTGSTIKITPQQMADMLADGRMSYTNSEQPLQPLVRENMRKALGDAFSALSRGDNAVDKLTDAVMQFGTPSHPRTEAECVKGLVAMGWIKRVAHSWAIDDGYTVRQDDDVTRDWAELHGGTSVHTALIAPAPEGA